MKYRFGLALLVVAGFGLGARCCADQHEDCSEIHCYPWLQCLDYELSEGEFAETCEIPCLTDDECPWGQSCVDVTPGPGLVCIECIGEGSLTDDPALCCSDLKAISNCIPGQECAPSYYCTACGDGICGEHESPWECPSDCNDCSGLYGSDGEITLQECADLTVTYWKDIHRIRTAENLATLDFEDRALEIEKHSWFGIFPGRSFSRFHSDGALHRLSGLSLEPGDLGLDTSSDPVELAETLVSHFGILLFGISSDLEAEVKEVELEQAGETIVKFIQSLDGVPIIGAEINIVFDANNRVTAVYNSTLPSIPCGSSPDISLSEALQSISDLVGSPVVSVRDELYIYPDSADRSAASLVYEITVAEQSTGKPIGAFRVDAITGSVLKRHDPDWRFPLPEPPTLGAAPKIKVYDGDQSYSEAYNCVPPEICDFPYHHNDTILSAQFSKELIWEDGAWTDPFDITPLQIQQFGPAVYTAWYLVKPDYESYSGVVGSSASPMVLYGKSKMMGETVGFFDPNSEIIWQVEGATDVGTFSHEFGHRMVDYDVMNVHDDADDLEEGLCDALGMIYGQRYFMNYMFWDVPEETCMKADGTYGSKELANLAAAHSCFDVWGGDGLFHQNIKVHEIGKSTRCSALEQLQDDPGDADLAENNWRSYKNPLSKNHGHGRGPGNFDQMLREDSHEFDRDVMLEATNRDDDYLSEYCSGSEYCECSQDYGVSHQNNGINNRFFFDLSAIPGSTLPLSDDVEEAAESQRTLLHSIFGSYQILTYDDWSNRIIESVNSLAGFSADQKKKVMDSFRKTKLFVPAGERAGFDPSDIETVWHWKNVNDQRLYVFYRDSEESIFPLLQEAYPRHLRYAVFGIDGTSQEWSWQTNCQMPTVEIGSTEFAAISGYAPTTVHMGDRIWVGWNQFEELSAENPLGTQEGRLAYASLYVGSADVCGTWSGVEYDEETPVYGSPRAALIDRGKVEYVPIDFEEELICWPPIECGGLINDFWELVNPVDEGYIDVLASLGFTPDRPMDTVWRGHPGYGTEGASSEEANESSNPPDTQLAQGIKQLLMEDELGASRLPQADHPLSSDNSLELWKLISRDLSQSVNNAGESHPEITEKLSSFLPNAVELVDMLKGSAAPVSVKMELLRPNLMKDGSGGGGPLPPPPEESLGTAVLLISVSTVAVSFLAEQPAIDSPVPVKIRQYGISSDPFNPVDRVIGEARFPAGLATVSPSMMQLLGSSGENAESDNLIACTDFANEDGIASHEVGRMMCKVYKDGVVEPSTGKLYKVKPSMEMDGRGIQANIGAAPRAISIGHTAYFLFRRQSGTFNYVAFSGPNMAPITIDSLWYGMQFPASFDGPSKLMTNIDTGIEPEYMPSKQGESWPLLPGSFFRTDYGALGIAGVSEGDDLVFKLRGYTGN